MNEKLAFFELNTGKSALVVGFINRALALQLDTLFEAVVLADWDADRLDRSFTFFDTARPEKVLFSAGSFPVVSGLHDLILVLWAKHFLGDPSTWIKQAVSSLEPRGRIRIIDTAERKRLPEQELTFEALNLDVQFHAATGQAVFPGQDVDTYETALRAAQLNHVHQKIFTDPELIMDSPEWQNEISAVIERFSQDRAAGAASVDSTLESRFEQLRKSTSGLSPATPPFFILSGISPTLSTVFQTDKDLTDLSLLDKLPEQFSNEEVAVGNRRKSKSRVSTSDFMDKLRLHGPDKLKSYELLEIALAGSTGDDYGCNNRTGDHKYGKIAQQIIGDYGLKAVAWETSPGRLAEQLSISVELACRIVAIFALGRRIFQDPLKFPVIRDASDAYNHLREMSGLRKEHLRGLYLNFQNRLIHDEVISIGSLSRSVVHPREVFAPALEYSANNVIIAHNHPSGDSSPSAEDITITRQLIQAGRIMGIELLDHIVIGRDGYKSLKDEL